MMWDLSGGASRAPSPHVAMPVPVPSSPLLAVPDHRGRPKSMPGPGSPMPMPMLANPDAVSYAHTPTPRGFLATSGNHHHHQQQPAAIVQRPSHSQPPALAAIHSHFQYSKCTGRRRAVCIGINYRGQPHELKGCINDAKHVYSFLVRRFGYKPENIVVLTDDTPHQRSLPTRRNMLDAMRWLVKDAKPHDSLFFHYSGHGGQQRDLDGDEVDGYDETIYPLDYNRAGPIVDDEMHDIMVKPLPSGCRLTAVFDSCHSGTVLDLPYVYDSRGRLKGRQVSDRARARKATPADVISWSGCKDGQTSADTFIDGEAVGAASHAFIKAIDLQPHQSYQDLLYNVRKILQPKFSQKPQLGSSHPIDTSLRFIM
ncbi:caspase domain-containing protein [Mycena amicta]|nr:caspase domain-containing protein [Mycena amicta]